MPITVIAEKDLTAIPDEEVFTYTTFIPGKGTGIKLCYTTDDLNTVATKTEESYKMANRLIDLGMPVLYAGVTDPVASVKNYDGFWKQFEDKGKYNIMFITTGVVALDASSGKTILDNAIKCAATRGDSVAIVNTYTDVVTDITTFVKSLDNTAIKRSNGVQESPLKYGAAFVPKCGSYTAAEKYLTAFAEHINQFPGWFAYAGSQRGTTKTTIAPSTQYGEIDIQTLQSKAKDDRAVNPICNIQPYGDIVWGNRTLFPNVAKDKLVASSFLNVRLLCNILKKRIWAACRKFTFEPNTDVLWSNFVAEIAPLLDEMKSNQGIEGYKIIRVPTNERAKVEAIIRIVPIEAVEDFDITVELSDSIEVSE